MILSDLKDDECHHQSVGVPWECAMTVAESCYGTGSWFNCLLRRGALPWGVGELREGAKGGAAHREAQGRRDKSVPREGMLLFREGRGEDTG